MSVYKVQAVISGFPGGPGVNTFYVNTIPADLDAFQTFYDAIKAGIPSSCDVQVLNENVKLNTTTGALEGGYSVAALPKIDCTGGGVYASGVGYTVRWLTGVVVEGRRLIGHTYVVPLVGSAFDADGTPADAFQTTVTNAGVALIADCSGTFGVWHRPVNELNGSWVSAEGALVPARPAFLSSRRG